MRPETTQSVPPAVPLTLEGSALLHQMFRFRWTAWRELPADRRAIVAAQAIAALEAMAKTPEGESAVFSMLGHKGDLMFVHFRQSFDQANAAELQLANLDLAAFLEPTTSYVSVVELGLYESTVKMYASLAERGIAPGSEEWERATAETLARQAEAMAPRLYPEIPPHRYLCFYPMDKKRGESRNWYQIPMGDRQRMMAEHGLIGRKYAGTVKQIISGSIGFDDWEWGVDLFADDPLVFKRLIYEMRFDEASAVYALFGPFYLGLRVQPAGLAEWLEGSLPEAHGTL